MQVVAAGALELAIREWGDPACMPMLCWHGAGDQSRQFEQAAQVWADEDGLRVVALDAPGHGRSKSPPDADYRPSRLAASAAGLLDSLSIQAAIWCGFSWGAAIGCRFAATFPDRTRALVLIEGGFVDPRDDPRSGEPPAGDSSLGALLERGLRSEPVADVYGSLGALPVLLVTASSTGWRDALGFDPVERFRTQIPRTDVREVESPHGSDLLAHDVRNLARLVGDWLADRDLL